MKPSQTALSLLAGLVFVAAVAGLYRNEVGWWVWGLIYGNPVKWGDYSVPLSADIFVASLPDDRLLVIGSKNESSASLRFSVVPGTTVKLPGQCASVGPSCQISEKRSNKGKIIQIRCGPDSDTSNAVTEHYCIEGTGIRITYSGSESARNAFESPIRSVLEQTRNKAEK